MSDPVVLWLPRPPSANRLWRSFRGRNIKSKEYRKWLDEAVRVINVQRPRDIKGRYRMFVMVERPDRRRRDLSNLLKATEDALVMGRVIEDDSLAERITLQWSHCEPVKDAQVIVQLEEHS